MIRPLTWFSRAWNFSYRSTVSSAPKGRDIVGLAASRAKHPPACAPDGDSRCMLFPFSESRRRDRAAERLGGSVWTAAGGKNSLLPVLCLLLGASACAGEGEDAPADTAAATLADAAARACLEDGSGYLAGRLYGAIDAPLDWRGGALECEGMPRPDGAGARLRFARRIAPTDADLVIIVGIDGLDRGATVTGRAATITVIDEHSSRFYSNSGEQCWADVTGQEAVPGPEDTRAVTGRVYCTAALPALNGRDSISLDELEFRGRIDWAPAQDPLSP